jgi:UDP-N-acetylglucosamine 2-epimerase (non-hydrolysing)
VTTVERGGTNVVLGADPERIADVPALLREVGGREAHVPPLWDGKAAERVADVLERFPLAEPLPARSMQ